MNNLLPILPLHRLPSRHPLPIMPLHHIPLKPLIPGLRTHTRTHPFPIYKRYPLSMIRGHPLDFPRHLYGLGIAILHWNWHWLPRIILLLYRRACHRVLGWLWWVWERLTPTLIHHDNLSMTVQLTFRS